MTYEWRWGARSHAEVGEQALAAFVAEFMAERTLRDQDDDDDDDDDAVQWNLDLFPKPTAQPTREHWKVCFKTVQKNTNLCPSIPELKLTCSKI